MKWAHKFLLRFRFYQYLTDWAKTVYIPGFRPLPLYTVVVFFFFEIQKTSLANRAAALAYNFMLALFPAIIFLFTLIAYIPVHGFQKNLLSLFALIMPVNVYKAFYDTIVDIVARQNGKLLSVGFITALYFATNGVSNLMQAFNKSSLILETRSWLKRRFIALLLTVIISIALLIAIIIMIAGQSVIHFIQHELNSEAAFWTWLLALTRWLIILVIFFTTICILYRYGPSNKRKWKFINPGSILATSLAILTSIGFTYYTNNFSSYNAVYGAIGTLIVVMIYLYLNSMILLIGFELNASVDLSKRAIRIQKPRFNTFRTKKNNNLAK
ncbi:YihY/virulence factor BrkB family protein [Mucilaginibacter sp. RB4R14]|uniref:YihY/virulence factor BrkB family protein n=1 Tax=Mucilaginibacter aurantiaciroseus TaxID=2949308 RepID=UPI0020913D83|nr:YihY/virulence factor BrkB family protein [Mucilaginibacter aurantiaciroseus]MCO5934607.1 YihY/virulence factor BrkB family protein [Mucilaginibacter aurantiaciroseus]